MKNLEQQLRYISGKEKKPVLLEAQKSAKLKVKQETMGRSNEVGTYSKTKGML